MGCTKQNGDAARKGCIAVLLVWLLSCCAENLGLQRLSQKGTQPNATAFLALTIQALIKLNCFDLYLLRQPLQGGEG